MRAVRARLFALIYAHYTAYRRQTSSVEISPFHADFASVRQRVNQRSGVGGRRVPCERMLALVDDAKPDNSKTTRRYVVVNEENQSSEHVSDNSYEDITYIEASETYDSIISGSTDNYPKIDDKNKSLFNYQPTSEYTKYIGSLNYHFACNKYHLRFSSTYLGRTINVDRPIRQRFNSSGGSRIILRSALRSSRNFFCALLIVSVAAFCGSSLFVAANKDAARLFEDLLADYNKLVRPVDNNADTLVVKFKLKLSQLLDVHEKQQIMTTNVWLQHSWTDLKLRWNPADYGGVDVLYVPSEMIWLPDIVLYNNADGNYQVTIMTKAKLTYDGTVEWMPPAIYKSMCQINIKWFPFDEQNCEMKFGSWTYGGLEVDLKHKDEHLQREELELALGIDGEYNETIWVVDEGIDLSDYYPSVEWDILRIPGKRHEKRYPCCESPFIDLTYEIYLRRKTLFYTVNLMIPCVGISFLTALVFYLPSDGGEKISLCISILISLTVFFLLLVEIIPSTSLVIPLIGKYLLFTMVLVTLSVIVTVITLNVHYRAPATHKMSPWMRKVFIEVLPYYLLMRRPVPLRGEIFSPKCSTSSPATQLMPMGGVTIGSANLPRRRGTSGSLSSNRFRERNASSFGEQMDLLMPPSLAASTTAEITGDCLSQRRSFQQEQTPIRSAVESVTYISEHFRKEQEDQQVIEDWKYVSVVMDRIFLILFTLVCFIGTGKIIFGAPTIYDMTEALA